MSTSQLPNSLFLDFTSHNMTEYSDSTWVQEAYGNRWAERPATESINVAIVLPRAQNPEDLLSLNWAERQKALQQLEADGTLWSKYGADEADYATARDLLTGMGFTLLGDAAGSDGYISSAASRTIWLQLDPTQFESLFGQAPYQEVGKPLIDGGLYYWNGSLSLPTELADMGVGLWFDFLQRGPGPAISDLSSGRSITLEQGPQSIGNSGPRARVYPNEMADRYYNFPLAQFPTVPTATVGLIEPGSADALPSNSEHDFQYLLRQYQQAAGVPASGSYYSVANNGKYFQPNTPPIVQSDPGERSLDVGVIAAASPGSPIGLYAGSGFGSASVPTGGSTQNAYSNVFTAFQGAFWDLFNNPQVISASTSMSQQTKPGSPFWKAAQALFVDAALRNITVLKADNDFGSSWGFSNGLANQNINASSPYAVIVGGTSLTTQETAPDDLTVATLFAAALAGDLPAIWRLVIGGLKVLPGDALSASAATFLETVWNQFSLAGTTWTGAGPGFGAGDGGVDVTQPIPSYQVDFGLTPTSANPGGRTGRGAPDVSAVSGGNMAYLAPDPAMGLQNKGEEGTSAAAPLWAALIAQIDTIFADQGLPSLGYANDLLYTAAAVTPASFNDIIWGDNTSSWAIQRGGPYLASNGAPIAVTGYGYEALPGYDLATGLGSPNGVVLARTLSAIAQSQMFFADAPPVAFAGSDGDWSSGVIQNLLFQTMSPYGASVDVTSADGAEYFRYSSGGSSAFAWTSRLAIQSLDPDFDPNIVRLFDKQGQGALVQHTFGADDEFSLEINGRGTSAPQNELTAGFGFIDMTSGDGTVRAARPVAVAETVGGADDQQVVVRMRQNGQHSVAISFYRVDDYAGTVAGVQPGEAGYAAAAQDRTYRFTNGSSSLAGPGYGNYTQAMLRSVDAGDLVAMKLVNNTTGDTFWSFAEANEVDQSGEHVGHVWNYGLNTWGFEDLRGGGDRDFNDAVVQLDFTAAYGNRWLV